MNYNGQANAILCTLQGSGMVALALSAVAHRAATTTGIWWWVGSRTQWNVTKDFYMGLDVAYLKISGHEHVRLVLRRPGTGIQLGQSLQ